MSGCGRKLGPYVASYGGGVNSTAMLIGMCQRGDPVDLILFADPGNEKPETYAFIQKFGAWLNAQRMPRIITVRKTTKRPGRVFRAGETLTLERYCLGMGTIPSVAYGFKTCSLKFKREPQEEFIGKWGPARRAWESGQLVSKMIGFDADEQHRGQPYSDDKYINQYPLIEWGWGRDECRSAIRSVGLCIPPKSSCFFCPNMKSREIFELRDHHPELLSRALNLEASANYTGASIRGLARDVKWAEILDRDARQLDLLDVKEPSVPCECYDG